MNVQVHPDGTVELWEFSDGGGPIIRCFPDGRIELFGVPAYGGEERPYGNYPTICAAIAIGKTFT